MLAYIHHLTGRFLLWIINITSYHTGILIKDTIGDILCAMIGGIIAIFFFVLMVKDNRINISDKSEYIFITKIRKNNSTKIFTTLPPSVGNKLTVPMSVALLFNAFLMRVFPIKQIQFISPKKIYFCLWTIITVIFIFFILSLSIDFHVILPKKGGGYYLKY